MPLLSDLYPENPGAYNPDVATPTTEDATATGAGVQDAVASTMTAGQSVASQATGKDATAYGADVGKATAATAGYGTANAKNAANSGVAQASYAQGSDVAYTGYNATSGAVDPNQMSSYQLNEITSQNSPNMVRAYRQGMLTAGRRGLQNSTIAGSAAQGEMIDRATPLALQDATTYSSQALANQRYQNEADQFGANAANQAWLATAENQSRANLLNAELGTQSEQFNVEQQNQIERLNAQLGTDVSKFNADQLSRAEEINAKMETAVSQGNTEAYNEAQRQLAALETEVSQGNADRETRVSALNAELETDVSKFNADQLSRAEEINAKLKTAVSQGNSEAYNEAQRQLAALETEVSIFNADQAFKSSLAAADMTNEVNMETMRQVTSLNEQYLAGTQAMDLAQIQGQYQQLITSNEVAGSLYSSYFDSISQAMANPDISPQRLAHSIGIQQSMLEAGLRMIDNMNNLNLDEFVLPTVQNSDETSAAPVEYDTNPGANPIPAPAPDTGTEPDTYTPGQAAPTEPFPEVPPFSEPPPSGGGGGGGGGGIDPFNDPTPVLR